MSKFSEGGSEIFRHEWRERETLRKVNDALLELFDRAEVNELLDPGRPSIVAGRRRRRLFRR